VLKVLVADYEKCTGCRSCEMACSLSHFGECNPVKSAVQVVKWEEEGLDVIDANLCIGCRMCMVACPFGAIAYIADLKQCFKCDLCGGDPLCIRYCEPKALTFEIPPQTSLNRRREVGMEMVDARQRTLQAAR
jgi:carbon-monoxide dehydrogenase iron sulfur subunit